MKIPDLPCKIEAYCSINPSEDPTKVKQSVSNILVNTNIKINGHLLKATSDNLDALSKIYEDIHARKTQKTYKRHLTNNLVKDSTWFFLNKQAAFANTVALCDESDESPLGPIKVILTSNNIEKIIDWIISEND